MRLFNSISILIWYLSDCVRKSVALSALLDSVMPPAAHTNCSENDMNNAEVPICDIIVGRNRKRKNDHKEVKMTETSSDEEAEEAPRITKKRIVKLVSDNKVEDKKDTESEKDDVSDYEVKKVNPNKKKVNREKVPKHESNGLSTYEKMIEANKAERLAILKSMGIDQIKSEISEAVSGIRQMKKNTISRSYKKAQHPVEPVRRSRRLANMDVDFSENALEKLAVKNSFQVSPIEYFESIPSEMSFKDALKSASSYEEECISDLYVKESKNDYDSTLYNRNVLKNMTLSDFNVCKVVPARITTAAWCPSRDNLIVAAGDKYGNLGLWKIQDSETNPHLFKVHHSNIPNMQFCPFNPTQLLSASYDGTMRCGDLVNHTFNEIYNVSDEARCTWFDFLSPTTFLVSQSNGQVALVDRKAKGKTGEKRHACHDFTIKTVSVHPVNKNVFITADNKKVVRLWDLRKLQKNPVVELKHHNRTVNSAYFSPVTGNSILTTSLDDSICILDSTNLTQDIKLKTKIKHNNFTGRWLTIFRATWLPNSDDIFSIGSMEQPRRIEIFDKDLNLYYKMVDDYLTTVTSVHRFHPYKSALAAGNSSGKLFVFT